MAGERMNVAGTDGAPDESLSEWLINDASKESSYQSLNGARTRHVWAPDQTLREAASKRIEIQIGTRSGTKRKTPEKATNLEDSSVPNSYMTHTYSFSEPPNSNPSVCSHEETSSSRFVTSLCLTSKREVTSSRKGAAGEEESPHPLEPNNKTKAISKLDESSHISLNASIEQQ